MAEAGEPSEVQRVLMEAHRGGLAPHIVVGWSLEGRREWVSAGCGRDHVFDLASLTKPLVTAWTMARLVERGWWQPSTPIVDILPELRASECDSKWTRVSIEDLATHAAGLPAWSRVERWRDVAQSRFEREVGVSQVYSDLTYMTLGAALERTTGRALDDLARSWLFGRRRDLFFDPARANDENARRLWSSERRISGHAGLFGSCDAVLDQAEALLEGGGVSSTTLKWLWTRTTLAGGQQGTRTPGWDTPTPPESSSGGYFSSQAVGHLGFTGTSLWIEPAKRLAICVLTDRVAMGEDKSKIRDFRPRVHDAVWRRLFA